MNIQSLRSYRIFNIALFDLVGAILGMILIFILTWYFHFKDLSIYKFVLSAILCTIPISIFFHVIFGINTQLNYNLGLSYEPKTLKYLIKELCILS